MKLKLILLAMLITVPGTYPDKNAKPGSQPEIVRMVELLANPDRFNGRPVTVIGYLEISYRGVNANARLCLSREDEQNVLGNGLGVVPSNSMLKNWRELTGTYVSITGTVVTSNPGPPEGRWIALQDITECHAWSDPNHPRATVYPPNP